MTKTLATIFISSAILLTSCQSAIEKAARNTTYSAYELIGVEKRDLLKSRVNKARDEEKQASQSFKSALDRLKDITHYDGGALERQYRSLQSSYDRAAEQAEDVRKSIKNVEGVAGDLFEEWEKEAGQIQTASLRQDSLRKLRETQNRYNEMITALKRSADKMEPVLTMFKDQTLYLKHNLNAEAIASLKGESGRIQSDIERLINEMNASIAAADKFIGHLQEKP